MRVKSKGKKEKRKNKWNKKRTSNKWEMERGRSKIQMYNQRQKQHCSLYFYFSTLMLLFCDHVATMPEINLKKKKKFSQHPANTKAAMSQPCQCLTHVCHKQIGLLGMSMLPGWTHHTSYIIQKLTLLQSSTYNLI